MDWNQFSNWAAEAILQAGRLGELLYGLGFDLDVHDGRTVYRAPCPVHDGPDHNFQLRTDGDIVPIRWTCFSHHCEKEYKPSLLGLVRGLLSAQESRKVSAIAAVKYLQKFLGGAPVALQRPPRKRPAPAYKPLAQTREQVRGRLQIPSPFFLARGFSPEILGAFDVGHSDRRQCSIVPLYDDAGQLFGHAARSEKPPCPSCKKHHEPDENCDRGEHKWRFPKGFPKGSYLYNYAAALRSDHPFVVLVEGPADVWRVVEAGFPAVAALGSNLSKKQADKLAALKQRVYVAFDDDAPGRWGIEAAEDLLYGKTDVVPLKLPQGYKDPGDLPRAEAKRWLKGVLPA